jgi:hypothetical protein
MKRGTLRLVLGLAATCATAVTWHSVTRPDATVESPTAMSGDHVRKARPQADPAELLDRVRTALASDDPAAVFSHLAALVRADPQAAARFAATNDDAATRELILHRVAQMWAARDAGAALAWAADLTNRGERDALVTDVCLQLAERDPAEAVLALGEHVAGEHPHGGLEALAQRWAEKDFTAARDWAMSRPESEQRDHLVARLAFHQAQDSPLDAASLVANGIPEGATQTEAVMTVLHQWATADPAAAAEWIEQFPEGGLKARAVAEIEGIVRSRSKTHR